MIIYQRQTDRRWESHFDFFPKRTVPGLFFVYFCLFKQTLQFLQCEKSPSSIGILMGFEPTTFTLTFSPTSKTNRRNGLVRFKPIRHTFILVKRICVNLNGTLLIKAPAVLVQFIFRYLSINRTRLLVHFHLFNKFAQKTVDFSRIWIWILNHYVGNNL